MNKKVEDEKIISVLLASSTRKEASKKLGITLNTLYARMNAPEFQVKYQKARRNKNGRSKRKQKGTEG